MESVGGGGEWRIGRRRMSVMLENDVGRKLLSQDLTFEVVVLLCYCKKLGKF